MEILHSAELSGFVGLPPTAPAALPSSWHSGSHFQMVKEAKNVATSPAICSCLSARPAGCRDTGMTPNALQGKPLTHFPLCHRRRDKATHTFPSVPQEKGKTGLEVAGPSLRVTAETGQALLKGSCDDSQCLKCSSWISEWILGSCGGCPPCRALGLCPAGAPD